MDSVTESDAQAQRAAASTRHAADAVYGSEPASSSVRDGGWYDIRLDHGTVLH